MRTDTFKILEEVFAMLPPALTLRVKEELRAFKETVQEDCYRDLGNPELERLRDIAWNACSAANNVLVEQIEMGFHGRS
jgi:hypothetical protein